MPTRDYEKEWRRELKRIRRQEERLEAKGFDVQRYKAPKKPKTVTAKSVERLKKVTSSKIYSKSSWTDPQTGKTYKGQAAKKAYEAARKAAVNYYAVVCRQLEEQMDSAIFDEKHKVDIAEYYKSEMPRVKRQFTAGGVGYAYLDMSRDGLSFGKAEKYHIEAAENFMQNLLTYCRMTKQRYTKDVARAAGTAGEEVLDIESEMQ